MPMGTVWSVYRIMLLAACSTTVANRLVVLRLAGHSHILARRYSNTVALSSSSVPLPDTDVQDKNTNSNCPPPNGVALAFGLLPGLARPWNPDKIVLSDVPSSLPRDWKPLVVNWNAARDILVRAETGRGKTSAYIIHAIESRLVAGSATLAYRRRSAGPLILAPTRELAIQIASDAQKLTMHQRDFEVHLLVGGAGRARQVKDWMESPRDLVVATPGRLRDLLTGEAEFRQGLKGCPMLILDEADTLLSMGFRDDIDAIDSFLPRSPARQTFLFSATMPRAVRQLASWILSPEHIFIDATPSGQGLTPHRDERRVAHTNHGDTSNNEVITHNHMEQFYTLCPTASDQLPTLLKLLAHDQLSHGSRSKVIIFCPTVQMAQLFSILLRSLTEVLPDDTTEIAMMHSQMKQSDRDRASVSFRKAGKTQNGRPFVLVSSDVSARGVGYAGVTRVIQVGIPSKETMYIHRMGRMARGIASFAPGKGDEVIRPVVRAELLLLPWEAGYMNWQLTSLPIKPLSVSVLDDQLAFTSLPSSTRTSEFLKSTFMEIQRRIDPADIRRTAASLLGYYLPFAPSLRLQPNAVLAGVSSWASECFNVSIPAITKFPRKFTGAYAQSTRSKGTKGLFVDGLKVIGASSLGRAKSKNRSAWEGISTRRKRPKRWH